MSRGVDPDPTSGGVVNASACFAAYDACNFMAIMPYELTGASKNGNFYTGSLPPTSKWKGFLQTQNLGGGFKHFLFFTPPFGGDEPILTSIFFKWVGSTTNQKRFGYILGIMLFLNPRQHWCGTTWAFQTWGVADSYLPWPSLIHIETHGLTCLFVCCFVEGLGNRDWNLDMVYLLTWLFQYLPWGTPCFFTIRCHM